MDVMPKWAEVVLVPLISLLLAAIISALIILAIGEDPIAAALVTIDQKNIYPIRGGIPTLIGDEAIAYPAD